jgi:hypothetical protein
VLLEAARNNAEWCDLVCRTHGGATAFHTDAWVTATRSPPAYPDAVTLHGSAVADDILALIDRSSGCSVKDSFASLDLSGSGFDVLFEAEWIHRPAAAPVPTDRLRWRVVKTVDELQAWASAHGGGAVFRPALLDDPTVAILSATDVDGGPGTDVGGALVTNVDGDLATDVDRDLAGAGWADSGGPHRLVAGAIGNRSQTVVGLSNLFTVSAAPDEAWAGAVATLSAVFPGLPLVGYEQGEDLVAALRAGFTSAGSLRVWVGV